MWEGESSVGIGVSDWSGEFLNSRHLLSTKLLYSLCDFIVFYLSVMWELSDGFLIGVMLTLIRSRMFGDGNCSVQNDFFLFNFIPDCEHFFFPWQPREGPREGV